MASFKRRGRYQTHRQYRNTITFNKVSTTAIRITFKHDTKQVALVELEAINSGKEIPMHN